ncbi:Hypothetical_protein [Hexamita inflata]|uniref:Hypothetical_protein n=1 Tax=Hexamita inflata TaxID=28002 RepID=A0ABP1HWU5_9EUKA
MGFIDAFIHCWHYFCQVRSGNTDKLNIISFQQNQQHKINLSTQLIFYRILTKTVVQLRRILQSFRSCHFFKNKKKKNKPRPDKKPGLSSLDLDRAVQLVQYNKNISKTYNFLTRKLDCPKQLSEEEIADQMDKLFPQPQYVKIPICVAPQGISNRTLNQKKSTERQ